jgi:type I restriction enzyme, S subunit
MKYSIVDYKKIITDNSLLRYDAEYYHPSFLEAENKVKSKIFKELRDVITVLTDYHANGSYEILRRHVQLLDEKDYALMIRTVDFEKDDFEHDVKYVSEHAYNFLKKSKVYGKEIIVNKIGNAGKVYIVPPLNRKITLGMNQFMLRPTDEVTSGFLYTYLVCDYGKRLLEQKVTGAVPLSIDKESVRSVKVPVLEKSFQAKIDDIINKHFEYRARGKALYSQAEQILLAELNLAGWKPKHRLSYVKNYSSTQDASRIDAEYFQPIYEEIVKTIISQKDHAFLGDLVSIKKCIEPGSDTYQDKGIMFLRVSNLSKFGLKDNNQKYVSDELYKTLKQHQPKEGEILLSKDATPGITYYFKDDPEKMVPSSGVLRLKVKDEGKLHPEYLTLVLNSIIVQKQIERDAGGSIINHWLVDQVKNTLIPILSRDKQKKIAETISQSFCNRELSKKLLNIAKRGVEMAIEKDEKTAEKWINETTKETEG